MDGVDVVPEGFPDADIGVSDEHVRVNVGDY